MAKLLGICAENEIAHAFVRSQKGDKTGALKALADIDLPISRTAAFMIVANHEGSQRAVDWLSDAGIKATDLDSEGKYFLLTCYLELSNWATAIQYLGVVTDDDLREAPVLHHVVAITYLLGAVPTEFRGLVLNQLPFEAGSFPLASDAAAIEARRIARRYFTQAAQAALWLNCPVAATIDDEYALWLELKDPDESVAGRQRLEAKFRDPRTHTSPRSI